MNENGTLLFLKSPTGQFGKYINILIIQSLLIHLLNTCLSEKMCKNARFHFDIQYIIIHCNQNLKTV